jgi:Flp pilus assembly protein TadG
MSSRAALGCDQGSGQQRGHSPLQVLGSIRTKLAQLGADKRGDVAMMFGLMVLVMLIAVGAGVDMGRWLYARNDTISALDAAVLAAGRQLQLEPSNYAKALAVAQQYYQENTKRRLPLESDNITFVMADNNLSVTAQGTAYIKTPFLSFAKVPKLALLSATKSEYSKATLAIGGNSRTNVEVSMMLDVSGSMAGSKLQALKDAATDLVNIVVWDDQSQYYSKVALAPFSAEVLLPSSWNATARGTVASQKTVSYACGKKTCTQTYKLTPCVVERKGNSSYTDDGPSQGKVMAEYATTNSCAIGSTNQVAALSNNKASIISNINALTANGGTAGHVGTAWAWYTLSPNWSSLFPANGAPAAYGTANVQKIAILMTDGEYNTQYDTNGIATGSTGAGAAVNGSSVDQAKALCDGMKKKNITVYTVGFNLGGNQTAIDTLNYCATTPGNFYYAENADGLSRPSATSR